VRLHLGVNLAFARKRWVEPEEWARIIAEEFELKYVEFCSDLLDPVFFSEETKEQEAKKIRDAVSKYKLVLYDNYTGLVPHCFNLMSYTSPLMRQDGIRWCEEFIKLSSLIGARGTGGHYDTIPYSVWSDPAKYEKAISRLVEDTKHLASVAKECGQEFITVEQMYTPNEVPYTISQARRFYEEVNDGADVPVYLTVDVGHIACFNYPHSQEDTDPYRWLEEFANVSPIIHLQQTEGRGSHHWPFTPEYNKVGIIEPERVIEAIAKSGSEENYLMFEIFHSLSVSEQQIIDDFKRSVEYWRKFVDD